MAFIVGVVTQGSTNVTSNVKLRKVLATVHGLHQLDV